MLFLHGGGFVVGREGYDAPLRELAQAGGCLIAAPDLRLAPEHPFPAAVEDAVATARWLVAEAATLGAAAGAPTVAGDSSGGNLAATVTHSLTRDGATPAAQLLIYPMLDATAGSDSYEEFARGYGFTSEKSLWYFDQYLPEDVDRATRRSRRCSSPTSAGCRPRWSSRRASTRCATTVSATPRTSGRPASRSSSAATRARSTASSR